MASTKMDDRLSLYECIRDKISDYFMKQSYTASSDLMNIFGSTLGDKMLWNLLIKGLFHHLHYIPKMQLNLINEQLSSRISELQHKQIQQRELELQTNPANTLRLGNCAAVVAAARELDSDNESCKSGSVSQLSKCKTKQKKFATTMTTTTTTTSTAAAAVTSSTHHWSDTTFSTLQYVNNVSDDMWIKIFQYLDLYSILRCERTCHHLCRVTTNNPACFTNFKYSFCPSNRSYMFRHYQRLNGINDPFYRFRHSTQLHLSFWSKENYEFRLLTAFGDRFRNVRWLTIEVNRESPLVDLSQLVKKYSNFFVSIRQVVICVHGLGQPHPNPHNRMITLYKSLISFILIRCSFIRTLTLNYSLLTQCYRHVSSCLELTQILCINSKSQLFNDHAEIQDDDLSNIIVFKMNNCMHDIAVADMHVNGGGAGAGDAIAVAAGAAVGDDADDNDGDINGRRRHHHSHHHSHHRHRHHSSRHHRRSRSAALESSSHRDAAAAVDVDADRDENKMKIIKLGHIETQIQREIKIVFYRRHVRYSFLSYFHSHIRSIHVHNAMGFSNDIESPESRRLNLDSEFGEYEFLEELCLYNTSAKVSAFIRQHCRNCPMLNRMNLIFDRHKHATYHAMDRDQLYKTIKVLLFNTDASMAAMSHSASKMLMLANDSNDNSVNENAAHEIAALGLDDETAENGGGGGGEEQKTDSSDRDGVDNDSLHSTNIATGFGGGGAGYRRGLIPKLMRKHLNIITLNGDVTSNIKLLINLEKTFEIIANDLGVGSGAAGGGSGGGVGDANSLLLQLNLFLHIHIDVECHTDEIKKLLTILKRRIFQSDFSSYHVIAKKIEDRSTMAKTNVKMSGKSTKTSRFGFHKKMTMSSAASPSETVSAPMHMDDQKSQSLSVTSTAAVARTTKSRLHALPVGDDEKAVVVSHSHETQMMTLPSQVEQDASTLISPSIIRRYDAEEEIDDDGNKSDGGNTNHSGSGLNFKDAVSKMKLFGKSVQKLIKSNNHDASSSHPNHHHHHETHADGAAAATMNHSGLQPAPNQMLRFVKNATVRYDDMTWICDCKYAQCSRKFRTLSHEDSNANNEHSSQ